VVMFKTANTRRWLSPSGDQLDQQTQLALHPCCSDVPDFFPLHPPAFLVPSLVLDFRA
jgi:hypothetical protein